MKSRIRILSIFLLGVLTDPLFAADKPNVVFILTDNQGAWQLGCYGNPDFKTPHIDKLADEGIRFTKAFANNAVCSPTRATYLTGLTPSQHGVHRYLSKGRLQIGPDADYTLKEFTTLPERLHEEGYVCGLSGKWHLGDNAKPQDGFSFWVTKQHGHSTGFLNQEVLEDGKFKKIPKHLSEYWTDRGIEFVEKTQQENPDKPFFLFLAYNGPYTLSGAMREAVPSPWSEPYQNNPLPSFPRPKKHHPWQRNQHDLIGDIKAGRNLAGQVTAVDAGVGRIMEMLRKKGLDQNTLVIYAADQGAVAGHAGFWGMGDHTVPLHGRDGTIHIPMIFRHPGKIPAGKTEDHIVTNYDFMPSVLSYLGLTMPDKPLPSPGRDFSPMLKGERLEKWDDVVFYEFENVRSIRTKNWKYVERLGEAPEVELFDLQGDPDELSNLASRAELAKLRKDLQTRLHSWFKKFADPKWDLWNGGGSKSRIGTARQIEKGLQDKAALANPAPKHRAIQLQGVHAYPNRESVAAGESIQFHVSSRVPYRFRVTKLGEKVDDRGSDRTILAPKNGFEPEIQPIHPGSYVEIKESLPAEKELTGLTVESWVRPWNLKRWQGVIAQQNYPSDCGYGLFINHEGRPVFEIGNGGEIEAREQIVGPKLQVRQWHHLAGTWDGERAIFYVDGKYVGEWLRTGETAPRRAGNGKLRIGAYAEKGIVTNFLDGDIAMPAIYETALPPEAIVERFRAKGLKNPTHESLIACWPLDEERGNKIRNLKGKGFDGEIINLGTWMIGGPSFDGTKVNRFDNKYDPDKDTTRGHGLRLASDDLYDCGWKPRHTFRVPKSARSGIYAAWFDFELNGVAHHYPVTFVVKKEKSAQKAPIALMCSTTTWRAYNGTPFAANDPSKQLYMSTGGAKKNDPANPPVYNFYRDHGSGQPSYQVGLRIPWPVAGPDVLYSDPRIGYSHLMRGERFTHVWLEKQGYDFDVITNLDLHRDPNLLDGYKTLIINGHDEYWSREMYEGLDRYLQKGGTTAVLSGNTMFWRITVDDELGILECRKFGPTIGGRKFASVGEIFHSHDQRRGSLMRNCGLPPWKNIGLECSGWWGGANNGLYTATAPDHFLFQTPEKIDFSDGKIFGGEKNGPRKAGGHEGDIRLSSYAPPSAIPAGAHFPSEPKGITTIANIKRENARVLDYFANFGQQKDATLVDMIYWERPRGGKVFNAGAIGFGWTLDVDPKQGKLLRNVLWHLAGVRAKTPHDPAAGQKKDSLPKSSKTITPETDHAVILRAADARISGRSLKVNPKHGALAWWKTPGDIASWKVRGAKNGSYVVALDYALPGNIAGQEFVISVGDAKLKSVAAATGGWGKWAVKSVGEIEISKSDLEISFAPARQVKGEDLLDLRAIHLIPTNSPRLKNLKPLPPKTDPNLSTKRKVLPGNSPAPVSPEKRGAFELTGANASLYGDQIELLPAITGWNKKGDRASWQIRGLQAGRYDLLVDWAMPRVPGGLQKAALTLDGTQIFTGNIRTTEGQDRYARYVIGTVELPAGDHELSFGPNGPADTWVRLRSLRLVPAAAEGEFTMPPLTVPDGFVVEAAAIPPLVSHPMMACLDDRGRMFISESAGTNAKAPELLKTRPHKILMLEDMNEDGVFDKSTVFAENLVLPNGAQWHDGALYVCSPPYIWKFEDTTGDGKADQQTPVGGKFGFNGMSSAFHGPVLGPDGRMYWCGGQHGWTLGDTSPGFDLAGPWTSRGPGVFSMWPDGSDPENRAQGGMANPVEVTFSSEGEVFGTVAVYENLNGRTDALLHWIHGTIYNLKRRGPPVHPYTSRQNLLPMSRRGWVAPPGLCRYRSGDHANGFGEEYRDDIFLTEFNTHRVYRIKPERKGASYVSTDEIFLESTSPYTHFTDAFEDADGSLLVVDTGGWFLYGCPTSAIERPEIKGGIYRIRRKGSQKIIDPRGIKLDWKNPQIEWLDDPRFTVRDRAKTELAKRGAAAIPALEKILTNPQSSERIRREAVWTLTRIDHQRAREVVTAAMFDKSPSVRLASARSTSAWRYPGAVETLLELLRSKDEPQIIREAATALGRIKSTGDSVTLLMEAVKSNGGTDPYLDHSLIYALFEIDDWNYTQNFLSEKDPHVRRAALIACAEMESSKLTADQLAPHLASEDADLRAEALRLATARPAWGGSLVGFLKKSLEANSVSPALSEALLAFSKDGEVQKLIADALQKSKTRSVALSVIGRANLKMTPPSWQSALRSQLESAPDAALIETIGQRRDFKFDWLKIAVNESEKSATRLAALQLAVKNGVAQPAPELFDFLNDQFNPQTPISQRVKTAGILAHLTLTDSQQQACAQLIERAGPLEINSLLDVFPKTTSPETLKVLANSLTKSPGLFSVSATRLDAVFGDHPGAKSIIGKIRAAESEREARLDELYSAISAKTGNPERGKAAYTKATCIVCHKSKGDGGVIGPELSTIGAIRSERDLLEAIAFPSATFAREYEPFVLTMQDGSVKMGRLGHETETDLELIDATGQSARIPSAQIASREMASISMMPPGLERLLSPQELADLIAYLKSSQ